MQLNILNSLSTIASTDWNNLNISNNPFLRYEFLAALENTHCVGKKTGWIPQFITAHDHNKLIGAVPLYIKYHSYGEYIFDWAWANAYEQHGLAYYPKLLIGVPFTPVMGERFLIHPEVQDKSTLQTTLIKHCQEHARTLNASSIHCLFTTNDENEVLKQHNFMERIGHQFHWQNNHYECFDHFLSTLASRHRKKIKRERQRIRDAGIMLKVSSAKDINNETWQRFYQFYSATCFNKGGVPYLNQAFFNEISRTLSDYLSLVIASKDDNIVATALFFHNKDTWYGRYWGCSESFHSLHFETCYYTAIEHCINNKIDKLEAGAQGEHKLSRGFLPVAIHSSHQIEDDRFREAIAHYLSQEKEHILSYQDTLNDHSPFKKGLDVKHSP